MHFATFAVFLVLTGNARQIKREPSEILGQSRCCVPTTPPAMGSRREARCHCAIAREGAPVEIGEPEDLPNSFVFLLPEPRCAAFLCGAQGPRGRRARRCRRENRRGPRGLGWCRGRAPEGGAAVRLSRLRGAAGLSLFLVSSSLPFVPPLPWRALPLLVAGGALWATFLYNHIKR